MLNQKGQIPVQLKVSYKQQLQLKLYVPQQYYNKYTRHWLVVYEFTEVQQYHICKKYFNYLNEGDLIKVYGDKFKMGWKQKKDRKAQNFHDIYVKLTNKKQILQIKKISQKMFQRNSFSTTNILQTLQKIYEEDTKKQFSQLKVMTLFINRQSDDNLVVKILDKIKQINNHSILINIFLNQPIVFYQSQYSFVDQYVQMYKISSIQEEVKLFFYKLSKITVKKLSINIKCLDGELFRKDLTNKSQNLSRWVLNNNNLSLQDNFPMCNKIYIHLIQLRNLGFKKFYEFQLELGCLDINDKQFMARKVFTLQPIRDQFESIISRNYMSQNQQILKKHVQTNQSLNVQSIKYLDRLQGLKIICQRIQIQIKKNGNFQQTNNQQQNELKMLHSFQI